VEATYRARQHLSSRFHYWPSGRRQVHVHGRRVDNQRLVGREQQDPSLKLRDGLIFFGQVVTGCCRLTELLLVGVEVGNDLSHPGHREVVRVDGENPAAIHVVY